MASSGRPSVLEAESKRERQLLVKVLSDLIYQHCPNCLLGIVPSTPFTDSKLTIYSKQDLPSKYSIRDGYIRDTLCIPFENVPEKYYFYIKINDLLKNEIIQKKMQELIQKNTEALECKATYLEVKALTLSEKRKIAAFFNVFFAPFENAIWLARNDTIGIIAHLVNDRYLPRDSGSSVKTCDIINAITESFFVSPIAEELGFTQQLLVDLRETLRPDYQKYNVYFNFKSEAVLHSCLQVVKNLERLAETEITLSPILTENWQGFCDRKKTDTAQVKQIVDKLIVKDRMAQDMLEVISEVAGLSLYVAGIPVSYARMFKSSLHKKEEKTERKIVKPG